MQTFVKPAAALTALLLALVLAPAPDAVRASSVMEVPLGERLFNNHCSKCHGVNAAGTEQGPPLVHKIYHPNHHSDTSFRMAVRSGVRAHHWGFGNMPKIEGVSPEEIELIIEYVRRIQKQAGIY